MSAEVKRILNFARPVCNIVKSYSGFLTTALFCIIAFSMLPLHLIWKSKIQKEVMNKVNGVLTSSLGQLSIFVLFICLYMNGDVENMVLLLYVLWLTNNQ